MKTECFNLIDEPWIPVSGVGRVSLKTVFTDETLVALGGTPVEKIAIMKLLLAIAQSAITLKNTSQWQQLGYSGLAHACLQYLEKWYDRFYLYGETPFLQMPAASIAEVKSYGTVMPDIATGNTTCLTEYQIEKPLDDGQKALLLLTQMSFALGGKKTDNKVVLSPGYMGKTNPKGKPATGRPGPGLAFLGLLHSFAQGETLHKTLWFNVLTEDEIQEMSMFPQGVGRAPWEEMPVGEDCDVARRLKTSLMGRLIPLCRFCLLRDNGLHLTEGIQHVNYKEGLFDPSVTVNTAGKEIKVVWSNPDVRPWRELTALLGFLASAEKQYECYQLKYALQRAASYDNEIGVWAGGIRLSSNAGEQYVSGRDDIIESVLLLPADVLQELWFESYRQEMNALDALSKLLYRSVMKYFKEFNADGKAQVEPVMHQFWQLCERDAQKLIDFSGEPAAMKPLRYQFTHYLFNAYDSHCPNQTARQLAAWVKCRPNVSDYLK